MITLAFSDGSTARYTLTVDRFGLLRVESKSAGAQDLLTVPRLGWRIVEADPEDLQRLHVYGLWNGRVQ